MGIKITELKKILTENNYLTEEHFNQIAQESKEKERDLEFSLVQKGIIGDEKLGKLIAEYLGYPLVYLQRIQVVNITDKLLSYIPETVAFYQQAIIFEETKDGVLKLATCSPNNYEFIKQLEQKTGKKIEIYYTTPFNLELALRRYRGDLKKEVKVIVENFEKNPDYFKEGIVRLVNLFIEYAYVNQATDIHVTPLEDIVQVRFRIDGVLHKAVEYPLNLHNKILTRIKILASLRTDEHSATQDGRITYSIKGEDIDIRVSIVPVTTGENVVMRLLAQRGKKISLDEVGLTGKNSKQIREAIKSSWGMIIAAGPTGSGKTTSMYAVLHVLNQPNVNVMTIEDPVEYKVAGTQQMQINAKKGITFASGLRSIVRQDPDIILVGEIRDEETAKIAVNSAMTGHLILSTIHGNDSGTALIRLIEMGIEPFLLSSAVSVIIAQRLVRRLCSSCSKKSFLSKFEIETISQEPELLKSLKEISKQEDLSKIEIKRSSGCKLCEGTGYMGRIGVFEVMRITEKIRRQITEKQNSETIGNTAVQEGMVSMVHDGMNKFLNGVTSLEEVLKIVKI